MAFIDLTKAFDSVYREALWKILATKIHHSAEAAP